MTRFALNPYFTDERAPLRSSTAAPRLPGADALAGMLLAALVAAMLVVAGQVISTWADGHLLAAWVALWTVVFAAMAFLAPAMRRMAQSIAQGVTAWLHERAQVRADEALWELARRDPRVLAEIRVAQLRQQQGL